MLNVIDWATPNKGAMMKMSQFSSFPMNIMKTQQIKKKRVPMPKTIFLPILIDSGEMMKEENDEAV